MRIAPGPARELDLPRRRRELAARLAWAIPTEAALALIGDHGPILETGAGTGYWAALLRARGVDVVATDAAPPDDDAGHAVLRAYRGDTLLYVVGDADGPAGTARLHEELARHWTAAEDLALPSWPNIPDRLTVWRRR
ncbi:methyltransferase domain-containing protein [Dactylosporangium sucinum]|uniref:Methyltransferase n=1 Tax=Dactylosporangium sucinum TaxID=1424081 RepID=A0A917WIP9_9ACTN|nr:hypothetical protein [Dactylosporangium sucinum]GGM06463.1 hypothetical protein GCM10007977_004460 [Dactylosporangium sucinum]